MLHALEVALVQAQVCGNDIGWRQDGDWMTIPEYIASHRICTLPCSLLSQVLVAMKLKGHWKLSHRLKAEFFLRHLGRSAEEIEEILQNLKIRTRKAKKDDWESLPDEEKENRTHLA